MFINLVGDILERGTIESYDEIDLNILKVLQEDSRLSFNKIATKLKISTGTAYNRIKNLEEKGIIKGYSVLVDNEKLGYSMTALILIQAEGIHLVKVENEIAKIKNVVSVYDITGDYDVAIIARFRDRTGLNNFVKKLLTISHVKRTVTNVVLNVVKEDLRIQLP
jgi:DNA-binding Lrp family transcriptional regulator